MFWLVITVVLGVVVIAAAFFTLDPVSRPIAVGVCGLAVVVWICASLFLSVHTVGQRQVGIVYNFSGTISGRTDPGVVWTAPWQHVKRENVGLQREDFDLDVSNAAVSKDQQAIYARLTVNYQVEPAKVVDLFKTVGPAWKQTLLDSRVLQDFKEVTSQYTAAEITTKRAGLRADTKRRLIGELAPYDIKVVDVFVKNLGYTNSYINAINAKNVQVQRSLQAQAKISQAKAEGDQQLALARKQAQANHVLSASITPNLIRLKQIEKLNPNVQVIYVPASSTFLLGQAGSK